MIESITISDAAILPILEVFGLEVSNDGYIRRDGAKITDMNGEWILIEEFGGIRKNGDGYGLFKANLIDLIKVKDMMEQKRL